MVLAIIASNALVWTVVLALPGRAPLWLLIVLIVVISVGGPGSMVGFDFARTFNPSATLGTAQGMVNMGGFIASLLVMQAMGVILGATGGYSFESFRMAWTRAVRGVDARRGRHPDHPAQGPQADEGRAGTVATGELRLGLTSRLAANASATCRCPTNSKPTTLTTGASVATSRQTAIGTPAAANSTAATSTSAVSTISSTWNMSRVCTMRAYSR